MHPATADSRSRPDDETTSGFGGALPVFPGSLLDRADLPRPRASPPLIPVVRAVAGPAPGSDSHGYGHAVRHEVEDRPLWQPSTDTTRSDRCLG